MESKPQMKQFQQLVVLFCFFNKILVVSFIHTAAVAVAVAVAATPSAADAHVPAVYVFGDSLADVGNNNYLPGSTAVANFRPFGVDYPGGVPTGRFSNGYNFADFLAMKMGFRESPPPSLAVTNGSVGKRSLPADFRGLNFASGGSGILDSTGANVSFTLATQVDWFAEVVVRLVATKGKPAAEADLARSPFIFSAGANDLAIYLGPVFSSSANSSSSNTSSIPPPDVFVSSLVASYRDLLRRIYKLGARKFVFVGVAKAGCVPGVRALTANGSCLDGYNVVIQMFNEAVQDMLRQGLANPDDDLRFSAEGFQYSVTNAYYLSSMIIANPLQYGITEVKRACCGLGTFDKGGGCSPNTTNFCSDRAQHLFWDVSHPSQAVAKLIADYGFSGLPKFAYPINIAQLLHLDD